MRKAALLYNPDSGGSKQRQRELESAVDVLRSGGVEADLIPTQSPYHATEETHSAIDSGCDTIFACGGDGTIHNIVQVLANSPIALAILPMGTANALAHDLRVPFKIVAAAKASLHAAPRRIALGRVSCADLQGNPATRYFVVAAGVGVDAHLFYKLHTGTKQRMGMAAYYAKAWNLWFNYPMTRFVAEYLVAEYLLAEHMENGLDAPSGGSHRTDGRPHPQLRRSSARTRPGRLSRPRRHAPGLLPHRQPRRLSRVRDARPPAPSLDNPRY